MKKAMWRGIICALIVVMLFSLNAVSGVEKIYEEINTTNIVEEWYIETVDSNGGGDISIALDSNNYPHISYFSDDGLRYGRLDELGWNIETVDSPSGLCSCLSIDPTDIPHICFINHETGELKYAIKSGGSWEIQIVESSGWIVFASMTLDSFNNPHIAYVDYQDVEGTDNGALKYATKTNGVWNTEIVDSGGNVGFFASITLDSSNQPYIFYDDWAEDSLKMAKQSGSQWNIESIAPNGSPTDSAIGSDGNPHVCYVDYSTSDLKYAYKDGAKWAIETVDLLDDVGFSSLYLDNDDNPYISYIDYNNEVVKYAIKLEEGWEIETVDEGNIGFFASLSIDSNGNSHVAYFDKVEVDLKYATTWEHNRFPFAPQKPSGPTEGKIGESYTYSTSATDPDGDKIKYGWD